ncbi:hypothetical protein DUNSADRAFT_1839 [Dunaliella salina]|uniref:Uncharacterized protein n=1 Tax=Dunaliella salina TaxID=3046 RepID=A0ABQ7FWZ3_DUNSA|nr:hypothetical protein DUNSADRAFT_1839 [Dunaliella salina]|eukprot:KAF5826868.1 hypothetical protein DUNSADRAFT_1839 [Dunaliella salina]
MLSNSVSRLSTPLHKQRFAKRQVCRASRKEPRKNTSLEDARKHLQESPQPGLFSSFLNFVRDTSIGSRKSQPWWSPGRMMQSFLRPPRWRQRPVRDEDELPQSLLAEMENKQEHMQQIAGLLLFPPSSGMASLRRMVKDFPKVLDMPVGEVAVRLVILKDVLPGCDACYLIERYPRLFLQGDAGTMRDQVWMAASKLRHALAGARINAIIEDDPELLFMGSKLDHGLKQMADLWPTADEQCFANSEPHELACAVRALCFTK